jgi:hypothetical protein
LEPSGKSKLSNDLSTVFGLSRHAVNFSSANAKVTPWQVTRTLLQAFSTKSAIYGLHCVDWIVTCTCALVRRLKSGTKYWINMKKKKPQVLENTCAICNESDFGEEDDPLVSCECGLCVHVECYGAKYLKAGFDVHKARKAPALSLSCELCRAGIAAMKTPPCVLCGVANGDNRAMKSVYSEKRKGPATVASGWAHIPCVQYTPGAWMNDPEGKDGVCLPDFPPAVTRRSCVLCSNGSKASTARISSVPLTCWHPRCEVSFHVLCARKKGWECSIEDGALQLKFKVFCGAHSRDAHLKVRRVFVVSERTPCIRSSGSK